MIVDTNGRFSSLPRRLLAAAGLLPNAPGCGVNIFLDLCRRGLVGGPVVAVDARYSALVKAAQARSISDVLVFQPRSAAGMPLPDTTQREDWDRGPITTHLADRWVDLETTVEADMALVDRRVARLRPLDDLFAADRSCSLIVCADPPHNLEILNGGEMLLRRARPLILFETAGVGADQAMRLLAEFHSFLRSFDYILVDGDYVPLTDSASVDEAIESGRSSAFLGVPGSIAAAFDTSAAASLADFRAGFAGMLAERGAMRAVGCDDRVPAEGLYPAETANGGIWRWSGPGRRCCILLPMLQPGHAVVACKIVSGYAGGQAIAVIRANGADVKFSVESEETGTASVHFAVTAPQRGFRGWIELEIEHQPATRQAGPDSRRLGLCFGSFVIMEGVSNIATARL